MDTRCMNIAVVAGSNIQRGTTYGPLNEFEFPPVWISECVAEENVEIIQVTSQNGQLISGNPLRPWIQYLRSSRDIYEQNIEAVRSHGGVFIRVTRNVTQGELLCGWYDERYAREINVPYLTLQNIKGVRDYRCHLCDRIFGFPNVLKAHLMYDCQGDESRAFKLKGPKSCLPTPKNINFEEKSLKSLFRTWTPEKVSILSENGAILPVFGHNRKLNNSVNGAELRCQYFASINCHLSYAINNHSNMDPCGRLDTGINGFEPEGRLIHKQTHVTTMKENSPTSNNDPYSELKQSIDRKQRHEEEPMEAIHKSYNEFTTKRGHLCIYCGKFYSRKYGLKIHLRTHTGYKPLKCKICSRAFGDPSNLNKHIRLHAEGRTPYRCHLCGKLLVRRRDLVRHLNSRHPDEKSEHVT